MKALPRVTLGMSAVVLCSLFAASVSVSADEDAGAMRVIEHDHGLCRVVVPPRTRRGDGDGPLCVTCETNDVIDVLWCYTPRALAVAGTRQQLFAAVEFAVDDASLAFANTLLPFSVRTVGFVAVDYDESGDDLGLLQGRTDGVMDEIHAIRDAAAADIVALITETGSCGVAYVAPDNAAYGFQANSADCLINLNPFRHELGHNLGSQHFYTDTYGYFSYSSGHRFVPGGGGGEVGTAMGGNDIPHFSNPNVVYEGRPTGVPIGPDEEADNFSAFMQTGPCVVSFRCSRDTCAGDVTGDFVVDFQDVLAILGAWGECGACPADLNGNGLVAFEDIVITLGAWGPCP